MLRERMRGADEQQSQMFSYLSPEQRVRKDHPLRAVQTTVDEVLRSLSPRFNRMYAREGHRLRRRSCCGRWWYRCCTRSAASGC
jgi:hypothetical protein